MVKTKGTIDRFEGEKAVIRTAQDEIILPRSLVPEFAEGDVVSIWIMPEKEDTEKTQEIAQNLLKDILKED